MRSLRSRVIVLSFLLAAIPAPFAMADGPRSKVRIDQENLSKLGPDDQARVLAIADRLETISTMDRSTLTSAERKALRHETRQLKDQAAEFNRNGQVIYISAGTIIIILLILLIIT